MDVGQKTWRYAVCVTSLWGVQKLIHPDGKLKPQIHEIVLGNPGEHHAIFRHTGNQTHIFHTEYFECYRKGRYVSTHTWTQGVAWDPKISRCIKQFLHYVFFSCYFWSHSICRPGYLCIWETVCLFYLQILWFREFNMMADFSFMLCKLSHSVSTFCVLRNSSQAQHLNVIIMQNTHMQIDRYKFCKCLLVVFLRTLSCLSGLLRDVK